MTGITAREHGEIIQHSNVMLRHIQASQQCSDLLREITLFIKINNIT
jgi:hypothetical protein